MGIGEGLIAGLLGGVAGGAGQILQRNQQMDKEDETVRLEEMRARIAEDRAKALILWKQDNAAQQAGRISTRASEIAGQRKMQTDDVRTQADAAMGAYNDALKRGDITEDDAAKAAAAITDYSDRNLVANTKVTIDDRLQAASEIDPGMLTHVANYEAQKMRDQTNDKRFELQHADNMKRLDAQITAQDRQFELSMKSAERQATALENATARQERSNDIATAKLQYEASKTSYEGALKQITELQRSGVGKDDPQYADLVKEAKRAQAGMAAAAMLVSGGGTGGGKDFRGLFTGGSTPETPKADASPAIAPGAPEKHAAPSSPVSNEPSYEKWMAAKNHRDKVLAAAKAMSPGNREAYLESRLPGIEAEVKANENYRTY